MSWGAVGDLAINLIAAIIGFSVARLQAWLQFLRRSRNARRFMRGECNVVLSAFTDSNFRAWERSGLVGAGDVKALVVLERKLFSIREQEFALKHAPALQGHEVAGNLVLLGGPDANRWTAAVMERVALGVGVEPGTITFVDKVSSRRFYPHHGREAGSGSDAGVVVKVRSPFNSQSLVLVLAGGFGEGKQAAAELVCSPKFEDHPVIRSGADFELLFTVDIIGGVPQEPEVQFIREITS
ncbi:hypothetical protein [Modestobacter marinus]|uniref:hypothetical protein n=1 Tax=Modestobacter marinus TaxID=477641 RepID=UPI001C982BE7|nr:hypothetical protein [Modestobacter marinus]